MLLVWSRELHRRLAGAGVDVFAVHPGEAAAAGGWVCGVAVAPAQTSQPTLLTD
jgi:hypothetical protein